jgi:hypothetical protein
MSNWFEQARVRRVGKGALAPCPPFCPRLAMVGTLRFAHPTKLLRFTRKEEMKQRPRQNNPTGKSLKTLSSPCRKNISLNPSGKSVL